MIRLMKGAPRIVAPVFLLAAMSLSHGQPLDPRPVEPRPAAREQVRPEVEAYWRLQRVEISEGRLEAYKDFVRRFPGTQLALRVMREAADLYILEEPKGRYHPLEACGVWMANELESEPYAWSRYRNAPDSVFLDRLETHLAYARILASSRSFHSDTNGFLASPRTYDRALRELTAVDNEGEVRPEPLRARSDLIEQMRLTRCWCLHGKEDYRAALRSYEWFMESFPNSDFAPAALLNAASCLRALERHGTPEPDSRQRMATYQRRLLDEFPGSAEAVKLRQNLQSPD